MNDVNFEWPFLVGAALGESANEAYAKSSSEEKAQWKKERIMHHGTTGLVLAGLGVLAYSEGYKKLGISTIAFGTGLMLSDWDDRDRWFIEGKLFRR